MLSAGVEVSRLSRAQIAALVTRVDFASDDARVRRRARPMFGKLLTKRRPDSASLAHTNKLLRNANADT